MSFLSQDEICQLGFRKCGHNTLVSRLASIYNASNIELGDNVRIDDFCVLSAGKGGIDLGSHIHIAAYCSLIGQAPILIEDFAGLSSRVAIYSTSDDYSGASLTNPTIPNRYKLLTEGPVILRKHAIVGAGSVILPNVTLETGVALGALSLANRSLPEFTICSGVPARVIGQRKRDLLTLEQQFLRERA